jgi:divalent metal cation (Fe/Co/Zn/Cd) transporter
MSTQAQRAVQVRLGIRIEIFTVLWMVVEAAISMWAGVLAHSTLLTAFGIDSVIELISGAILLWRLSVEARGGETSQIERAEQRAAWVVAVSLSLLCIYVLVTAAYGLIAQAHPDSSLAGIIISLAAFIVMPVLGVTKRRIAAHLDSAALRGDAASSFTCGAMSGAVLPGVGLNALFHWWWAEDVASLLFLFWLVGETHEALEEACEGDADENDDE